MRNTKQRDCILDIINNSYDHLNAYQVYDKARVIIPNISLGTVYRNLSWLCDNDKIRFFLVDGIFRYDRKDIHDHFICTKCGNVIDIPRKKNITEDVDGNLVVDYEIKYRGICNKCQERKIYNGTKGK